ncbi:MAG: SDR family NAD(P)-dependent oxidoreductase [Myxococcota bacterium]
MRTVVLTGGTSGVGYGVAQGLQAQEHRVVALVRSLERGRALLPGATLVECDLSSQASVATAAEEILRTEEHIDVLVGCAGVVPWKRATSVDGFELTWATNILGHVRLTDLLRPRLIGSAPSRVVMISGNAHRKGTIHWDDLQLTRSYSAIRAGTQAALAKIMWTFWLARELEGTGVTANTFCPGFVRSGLTRGFPWWLRPLVGLGHLVAQTPAEGARTPLWLATDPAHAQTTGGFFRHLAPRDTSAESLDPKAQARLAEEIARMLTPEAPPVSP